MRLRVLDALALAVASPELQHVLAAALPVEVLPEGVGVEVLGGVHVHEHVGAGQSHRLHARLHAPHPVCEKDNFP